MKHNKKRSSWIVPVIIILLLIVFIGVSVRDAGTLERDKGQLSQGSSDSG